MTATTPAPTALAPRLARLGRVLSVPNAVTVVRTVAAVALGAVGVATARVDLLVAAYAAYWVGDIADGWIARRLGQETRLGAVFDIVCDRVCTILLCGGLLVLYPEAAAVVAVFLLSFAVVDTMLSLAFLSWEIDSPNYFYEVDRLVYRLNWSPPAKAVNTAGVVGGILLGIWPAALVLAIVVLGVKIYSTVRVLTLP